jgi:hypothetical protein
MKQLPTAIFAGLGLLGCGLTGPAACQEPQDQVARPAIRFEAVAVENATLARLQTVGGALGFSDWPRPAERYVAPAVSRSLLSEPTAVGEGVRACASVRFGDEPWGRCDWSWQGVGEDRQPSREDWLDLEVVLAPDARAAQEHLLSSFGQNMLPTEALVAMAQAAERPEGLGTVALLSRSRDGSEVSLFFSRANVAFHLRGHGSLAGEVLPLARRLDGRVAGQQPLTYEQLIGRRPGVDLAGGAEAEALGYEVRLPAGRQVFTVEARVDGQAAPAAGGRVLLSGRRGTVQVEVITITRELLAGAARTEVSLGE